MASLDKRYRPKTLKRIVGNTELVRALKTFFAHPDSFPATILLQGPSGCGKTTLARIIAKMLKVGKGNVYELNIGTQRKIDDARAILENLRYSPMHGKGKVIVLNECHKANNEFQNVMLETLEEPPPNVYFILCTTNPEKLLSTIKTRSTIMTVEKLDHDEITKVVKYVIKREKATNIPSGIVRKIATASQGSPRSALVILNSIIYLASTKSMKKMIANYNPMEDPKLNEFCQALLKGTGYKALMKMVKDLEGDAEDIRYKVLDYMSKVLISRDNAVAAMVINNFYDSFQYVGKAGLVLAVYNTIASLEEG
jgi:DNA polymerase-3 subunit gamma/tau